MMGADYWQMQEQLDQQEQMENEQQRGHEMKTCTKCGDTKLTTAFSRDASKRDGLHPSCKMCDNANAAKWYAVNQESNRACSSKWAAENADKVRAKSAKWYVVNSEKAKARNAKWYCANPEAYRIYNQNRRARMLESGGKLSNGLADKLFKLQRGKCVCGCKQPLGDDYHLDHIMPIALGGANTDDNIQLLRATCNQQKHAKHPVSFMQTKGYLL